MSAQLFFHRKEPSKKWQHISASRALELQHKYRPDDTESIISLSIDTVVAFGDDKGYLNEILSMEVE